MRILLVALCCFCLGSCASYKTHYSGAAKKQASVEIDQPIVHRMYLIGDAGKLNEAGENPVLETLRQELEAEQSNSSIVFLGDNIYPKGMPEKTAATRKKAEQIMLKQLETVKKFPGKPFFIPGNHDWYNGWEGRQAQENFVEKHLEEARGKLHDQKDYFLPDDGCPGPEIVELDGDVVLIIIDSEWWMHNWDREPQMHTDCEIRNRNQLIFAITGALRKYRRKQVVLALHHPPLTNGPHSGSFPVVDHLFPLRDVNSNLWIPLPLIGSLYPALRATVASPQDNGHPLNRSLMRQLHQIAQNNGNFIFASGHEHNLQYFERENQQYIVSGAGAKVSATKLGKGALYADATRGYSTIEFYADGSRKITFFAVDDDGNREERYSRYRRQTKTPEPPQNEYTSPSAATVKTILLREPIKPKSKTFNALVGAHYREVYSETYELPTLDLAKAQLQPIKRGGGNQTNSLRLEHENGHQYVVRDLTKDASRLLPFPLNKMTASQDLAKEMFLSTHPFAPLVATHLAEAAGLYATHPRLVYLPDQNGLGTYNRDYGNSAYLFEERPAGDWSDSELFGSSKKIVSTQKLLEKRHEDLDHQVDQPWTVRARLLDIALGDWDRHDDQWRWARFDEGDKKLYRPIPRDRDQAFAKYDGVLIKVARFLTPGVRHVSNFDSGASRLRWLTWSARRFDRSFLNELPWSAWQTQVNLIQAKLTPAVIDSAFAKIPVNGRTYAASIEEKLEKRIAALAEISRAHYLQLAEEVDVVGSSGNDYFKITSFGKDSLLVRLFEKSTSKSPAYERLFQATETKIINLYGLEGNDDFSLETIDDSPIHVRMIGGLGKDHFHEGGNYAGGPKITIIDDKTDNTLDLTDRLRDRRTHLRLKNSYDRYASHYEYNHKTFVPIFGVNPDDGVLIGGHLTWLLQHFQKRPYASLHTAGLQYAFATQAVSGEWQSDFRQVFGNWGLLFDLSGSAPTFTKNYFGLGQTPHAIEEGEALNFYRVRQSSLQLFTAFKRTFAGDGGYFAIGPIGEYRDIERTDDRFVSTTESGLSSLDFDPQWTAGVQGKVEFNNLDNFVFPRYGVAFTASSNVRHALNNDNGFLFQYDLNLTVFQPLNYRQTIIASTQLGVERLRNQAFPFYFQPVLGGISGLRGFFADRFYGHTVAFQNIDLRVQVKRSLNPILPITFGVFGGFDHGYLRSDEYSNFWRYNYGGGVWAVVGDLLALKAGYFIPDQSTPEPHRFVLKAGLGF